VHFVYQKRFFKYHSFKAKRRSFLWEIKDFGAIKKRLADGKTYTSEEFGFRSSSKNKPFWIPDFVIKLKLACLIQLLIEKLVFQIYLFRLRLSSKAGDLSQTYCSILSDNFDVNYCAILGKIRFSQMQFSP